MCVCVGGGASQPSAQGRQCRLQQRQKGWHAGADTPMPGSRCLQGTERHVRCGTGARVRIPKAPHPVPPRRLLTTRLWPLWSALRGTKGRADLSPGSEGCRGKSLQEVGGGDPGKRRTPGAGVWDPSQRGGEVTGSPRLHILQVGFTCTALRSSKLTREVKEILFKFACLKKLLGKWHFMIRCRVKNRISAIWRKNVREKVRASRLDVHLAGVRRDPRL